MHIHIYAHIYYIYAHTYIYMYIYAHIYIYYIYICTYIYIYIYVCAYNIPLGRDGMFLWLQMKLDGEDKLRPPPPPPHLTPDDTALTHGSGCIQPHGLRLLGKRENVSPVITSRIAEQLLMLCLCCCTRSELRPTGRGRCLLSGLYRSDSKGPEARVC